MENEPINSLPTEGKERSDASFFHEFAHDKYDRIVKAIAEISPDFELIEGKISPGEGQNSNQVVAEAIRPDGTKIRLEITKGQE